MPFLTSLLLLSGGLVAESGARSGTIGGRPIRDHWYDVPASATPVLRAEGGTSSEVTVEDRVYEQTTGSLRVTDFVWGPVVVGPRTLTDAIVRSSSNESVVVPDPSDSDRWTCLAEGAATLTLTNADREVSVAVEAAETSGGTTQIFAHYATGSLRRHIADTFAGALAGKSPATALRIFSAQDHASATYTRNTACWGHGMVDLSPLSPWNSYGGATRAGVLVSPRHVVFADHYAIPDGTTMRWVTASNVVHERTLVMSQRIGTTDLRVGVLSSDVPAEIGFARVLSPSWATKLPSYAAETAVLGVVLDQEEKLLIGVVSYINQGAGANCQFERPTAAYSEWSERLIGGDSGNPGCLVVNGQLVLLTCWAHAGLATGNGDSVVGHRAAIDAAMTSLGGGYQLTDVDLSGFSSY